VLHGTQSTATQLARHMERLFNALPYDLQNMKVSTDTFKTPCHMAKKYSRQAKKCWFWSISQVVSLFVGNHNSIDHEFSLVLFIMSQNGLKNRV